MKKQIIPEKIFNKRYEGVDRRIPLGDLPKDLLPTDKIEIISDNGFYSENEFWNAFTKVIIYRDREETDDEVQERVEWWEKKKEESRKKRYESYLKLKKEFEEGLLTKLGYEMSEEEEKNFNMYSDLKFKNGRPSSEVTE